jgi:aspartate aminotransferase
MTTISPPSPRADTERAAHRLSHLAQGLQASAILRIAAEVRAQAAAGKQIVNLTVGDFSAKQFRIPRELEDGVVDALRAGESTYPPPNGMESLRRAVCELYRHRFGREIPIESVLIASGARPVIYALYRAIVDPGERVVYGAPSWNNDYYCQLIGAERVPLVCDERTDFLPTADRLRPLLRNARLLALNSPLNPTGTLFDAETLGDICDLVLEENGRRGVSERPLFVMYDQVYWMLTMNGAEHVTPVGLRPAMAPYTIEIDAISKAFASTGLRVGWAVGPADVIKPMGDVVGHVGAWAPRPEQVATARFLGAHGSVDAYLDTMRREVAKRLDAVHDGLMAMKRDGLPVDCVTPRGAIYVSAYFGLRGKRTRDGKVLTTDDDMRRYLLESAGFAVVPFDAFGSPPDLGWFRISVGAVSVDEIREGMDRLKGAVQRVR